MTEYTDEGIVDIVKDNPNGKFQSITFVGRRESGKPVWFSNWFDKNKPLKKGAAIKFNYFESGTFKNITKYEHANAGTTQDLQKKAFSNANNNYTKASDIKPEDALKNLQSVVKDGAKILDACKDEVLAVFNTEELKPEHVACLNTLFIYVSKEIYFRNGKGM